MRRKSKRQRKKRRNLDGVLPPTISTNFWKRLAASPKSTLKTKKLKKLQSLKLELNSSNKTTTLMPELVRLGSLLLKSLKRRKNLKKRNLRRTLKRLKMRRSLRKVRRRSPRKKRKRSPRRTLLSWWRSKTFRLRCSGTWRRATSKTCSQSRNSVPAKSLWKEWSKSRPNLLLPRRRRTGLLRS